jgi:hypothetical protein
LRVGVLAEVGRDILRYVKATRPEDPLLGLHGVSAILISCTKARMKKMTSYSWRRFVIIC